MMPWDKPIEEKVYKSEPQHTQVKKHSSSRTKKMMKFLTTPLVGIILLASIGSAVLVTCYMNGFQSGFVNTPGVSEPQALTLYQHGTPGTDDWINLGQMINLDIPFYWTTILNGENKTEAYRIVNGNTHSYHVVINCSAQWMNDTECEYYGFEYGAYDTNGNGIDGVMFDIAPGETIRFDTYQYANPYYKTPTDGLTPMEWTIDSWIID